MHWAAIVAGTNSGTQGTFLGTVHRTPPPGFIDNYIMSTIVNRKGIWQARYTDRNGKQCRCSTHIKVKGGNGLTAAEAKRAAASMADALEAAAVGVASQRIVQTLQTQLEVAGITRQVTVRAWFREYVDMPEFKCNQAVHRSQHAHIFDVFCNWLGKRADAPLHKLKSTDIVDFLNYLSKHFNYARATVNRYRFGISVALNSAEHHELITRNPARTIKRSMIENNREKEEVLPFTKEQIQVLIKELPDDLRRLTLVSLYSVGQRLADCCNMRWDMFKTTGQQTTLTFRTRKTKRLMIIPVSDAFKALLREIKHAQEADGVESPYLFPQWAERPNLTGVSCLFESHLRRLKMVPEELETIGDPSVKNKGRARHRSPLCFHSLRHYVVSVLSSERQFSPDIIRESVGHSTEAARLCYVSTDLTRRQEVSDFIVSQLAC